MKTAGVVLVLMPALIATGCEEGQRERVDSQVAPLRLFDDIGSEDSCDSLLADTEATSDPSVQVHCIGPHQGRSLIGAQFSAAIDPSLNVVNPVWSDGDVRPRVDTWVGVDDSGIDARMGGIRLADDELTGLTFSLISPASQVQSVRIALTPGYEPDSSGRSRYRVEYLSAAGQWQPYCLGDQYAYAIPGSFLTGRFIRGGLTFVCQNSAGAKAIRWGYAPYRATSPLSGNLYEVATRLARADYCGTDKAHTVDGTDVLVYDVGEPRGETVMDTIDTASTAPSSANPFRFEAAWAVEFPRQSHALCLSKLRWQMLPPDFCGDDLPDPRTRATGRYCEDLGDIGVDDFRGFLLRLKSQGALIFSSSRYNEVGLWNWYGAQNRSVTTVTGYWAGTEGGISSPPRVNSQTGPLSISASQQGFVGVIAAGPHQGMVPLRLYFNTNTKSYRTSIRTPATWCGAVSCSASSWVSAGSVVGYVYPDLAQARGVRTVALRAWSTTEGPDIEQAKYILLPDGVIGRAPYTHLLSGVEGYAFANDQ